MDPFCDNFISYENQPSPNFEGLLDSGFSLSSPFTESVDSFCHFPDFFPKTIQNLLEPDLLEHKGSSDLTSSISVKKSKPFQIIKSKKSHPIEPIERLDYSDQPVPVYPAEIEAESENKINNRSKRIAKMAKAKGKAQSPQSPEDFINNVDVRLIPEGYGDPAVDPKTQKKMIKMIKNRISAQNSRDKKKLYTQQLEELNNAYADENMLLNQERNILLEKIEKLEADYALLRKENEAMKNNALNMCYKCGYTSEFETTATETSDHISSPILHTTSNNGNGGFSIFSVALAALLCFLFVITGGQLGEFPTSVINSIKTPTIIRLSKSLLSEFTMAPLKKLEESAEDLETSLKDLNFGDLPVFNKIKPLMEQFEKFHQTAAAESSNDNTVNFENSSVESESKISTLFVPAGFELSKNAPRMEVEGEFKLVAEEYKGLNTGVRSVGLEKADYIQLLVPKNTIGRLTVAEDSNEIKSMHDDCGRHEGENSLMEVWCKVVARRSSLITLA